MCVNLFIFHILDGHYIMRSWHILAISIATPFPPSKHQKMSSMCQTTHGQTNPPVVSSGQLIGTVKFLGVTEFATGEWLGIELDEQARFSQETSFGLNWLSQFMRSSDDRRQYAWKSMCTLLVRYPKFELKRSDHHFSANNMYMKHSATRFSRWWFRSLPGS